MSSVLTLKGVNPQLAWEQSIGHRNTYSEGKDRVSTPFPVGKDSHPLGQSYRDTENYALLESVKDAQSIIHGVRAVPTSNRSWKRRKRIPKGHRNAAKLSTSLGGVLRPGPAVRPIANILHFPPEDGAAQFFFNDYVIDRSVVGSAFFSTLPVLLAKAPVNGVLSKIIAAVGLASFSNARRVPDLTQKAAAMYATALRFVNAAIANPVMAKSDDTLIMVLLLALYEENGSNASSVNALTKHVMGALALLNERGVSQVRSSRSRQLIRVARNQIIANCLSRKAPVPQALLKWTELARRYESEEEVSDGEFTDIYADFCSLQVDLAQGNKDPEAILAHAMVIDAELTQWADKCPTRNMWKAIPTMTQCPDLLTDSWDTYRDIGVVFAWNHYRTIRILVNEVIVQQLTRIIERLPHLIFKPILQDQITNSQEIILTLAQEICASVPFYLGRHATSNNSAYDNLFQPQNAVLGRVLLWPLYTAGATTAEVSDPMRVWIAARLDKIADMMGVPKANALAKALRSAQTTRWLGLKDISGWQEIAGG
ncbi:hypothetical protein ACLMJK_007628 [Lecanora helva]